MDQRSPGAAPRTEDRGRVVDPDLDVAVGGSLGSGPVGTRTVRFAATDRTDGSPAQVIGLGPLHSRQTQDEFDRRLAAATMNQCPGLVTIRRGQRREDRARLVVDAVDGRPLPTVVAATGPMDAAALDVLWPLAAVLDGMHARGFVHGDLCPEAVVVGPDGSVRLWQTELLRLPDSDRTETGDVSAIAVHRPPEQGSERVGHRADVYAAGCLAFGMITGEPAFTVAALAGRAAGRVPSVVRRRPGTPRDVDAVFGDVLSLDPLRRPSSVAAFVDALARAYGRTGPRAIPPAPTTTPVIRLPAPMPVVEAAAKPRRIRPVVLTAVATVVVLLLGAVAWSLLGGATPSPSDPGTRFLAGAPIPVGANPADVEVGMGAVWASGADDGSLTRIDPATGAATRFTVGGEPGQVVVGEGAVWIRNLGDRITRFDPATGQPSAPIPGGGGTVSGMTAGGGYVWLSHAEDGTVTRVDPTSLAVVGAPIRVGPGPRAMEFDGNTVYVLNTGDGTLGRIDAATAAYRGAVPVGESLGGIEVDAGTVYVAADSAVVPVPESTFVPAEPYRFDRWSYFELGGDTMWVVFDDGPIVRRFDTATREFVGDEIPDVGEVGRARFGFDRLWLTDPSSNAVRALTPQ